MRRGRHGPWLLAVALVLGVAAPAREAVAGAFYARDEALALAFPGAELAKRTVVLTPEQVADVSERCGEPPESKLFTYWTAVHDGRVVGHVVIDAHVVRTLPEVFMAVLTPSGAITRVLLLAFYEPPEFAPPTRFLGQFRGRDARGDDWRMGRDLHGISGATLTAHAMRDGLRRVVALHDVVIRAGDLRADAR